MRGFIGAIALWIGLAVCAPVLAKTAQVFLIQNSGWMEPFYVDPRSEFKPLAKALITTVARPGDDVIVASFNQSVGTQRSPRLMYRGVDAAAAALAVDSIQPARKPGSNAYADTDFKEAISVITAEHLKASPAVIWILTNNRNSPGNDQDTAARNREFYALLHLEPAVVRTLAYPLGMPVQGRLYSARGLMVYALAYGEEAENALKLLLTQGRIAKLFTEPPARLKPLDRESVVFVPLGTAGDPKVRASLGQDGRTLVIAVDASASPAMVEIQGAFRNEFYPYEIRGASLSARMMAGGWSGDLAVSPAKLNQPLAPGADAKVIVQLPLPAAQMPSVWSPSALSRMGTEYVINATLRVSLVDQQLQVADSFERRIGEIFPGDPLPAVFKPSDDARASEAVMPVQIRVAYPLYPLVVVAAASLTLVGLALLGGTLFARDRHYEVLINGQPRKVVVKAMRSVEIKSNEGQHIATLKRGLGAPSVSWMAGGVEVRVKA